MKIEFVDILFLELDLLIVLMKEIMILNRLRFRIEYDIKVFGVNVLVFFKVFDKLFVEGRFFFLNDLVVFVIFVYGCIDGNGFVIVKIVCKFVKFGK